MPDDTLWDDLQEQCEALDPRDELVTPLSDRPFRVEAVLDDRIVIRFPDSDEERPLWRDQFEVFADRLGDESIEVAQLGPAVGPYAAVLSLSTRYVADGETITRAPDEAAAGASPYLVPASAARTRPERVHDDALLLADALDRVDATEPSALATDALTDLYVLLSDVQRGADRVRRTVADPLLDRLGPDQELSGRFGTVHRTTRDRRRAKDDETVLDAIDDHGIPREWVLGVDSDKLDVVVAVTDLDADEVYDVEEQTYVQKTGVDEEEKYAHLQGLSDRLDALDGERGESLRRELDDLEDRIDQALSAA